MIYKLVSAAVLGIVLFSSSATNADKVLKETSFPDLVSVDGKNTPVEPPIGNGKWTVVMVWSTSCHICEIDKPLFSEFHEKHKDGNIEVFGISIDGVSNSPQVKEYLATHKVSFPNSLGDFLTVSSSVFSVAQENLRGTPTYLLFNPEGKVVGVQAGHLDPDVIEQFVDAS